MKGTLKDRKEVAKGTFRFTFVLDRTVNFQAGQYIYITIPKPLYDDNRGNRRHFTITNSPHDLDIVITTRIGPSAFKRTLTEAPLGTEVELGPVEGNFTLPKDTEKSLVFIAGGIGVTPFMSMLDYIANQKLPYKITLIYSNRDKESTAYLDELEKWTKEIPDFKLFSTMTQDPNWLGEHGRVDINYIKKHLQELNSYLYFVSGPPGFVEAMKKVLGEAGVKNSNIRVENFTGY
ncbi:MAG: FAD-dependent oxidoreductase [bacterium]|nr:FAD-dependent oxidoreductase [bacterium]